MLHMLNSKRLKQGLRAGENFHFASSVVEGILQSSRRPGSPAGGIWAGRSWERHLTQGCQQALGGPREGPPQRRVLPELQWLAPTPGDAELAGAGGWFGLCQGDASAP